MATITKKISLDERLNTRSDYFIIGIIWAIYLITFISLLLLLDPQYGGLLVAIRFGFFFAIFPGGMTAGMIFDRYLVKDHLRAKNPDNTKKNVEKNTISLSKEDIFRIIIIIIITVISIPWILAIFGFTPSIFFNPVHIGENHGYYGYLLILFAVLNTKIIKYNKDSIPRELIIFGFIACSVWGAGWMLDDFLIEQFSFNLGFDTPFIDFPLYNIPLTFIIQVLAVIGISFLIYYGLWWKYYKNRIPVLQGFN